MRPRYMCCVKNVDRARSALDYGILSYGGIVRSALGNISAYTTLGYDGRMSGDAAGIVACLFAFSHLSFQIPNDMLSRHYLQLLDFAVAHREASAIFAATD
jgi:hypothetical protein